MRSDFCVVGGGLAGGIIASTLAADGRDITLIEQASAPAPLIPDDEIWIGGQPQTSFTRGEGPGGSSNFWHGALVSLDRPDVEEHERGWWAGKSRITYDTLTPYYARALRTLAGDALTIDDLQDQDIRARSFELRDSKFAFKPHYLPARPLSTKCLIEEAVDRHDLKLLTQKVEAIEIDDNGRALAVITRSDIGSYRRVEAAHFVLCAGGIGSAKILLRSANRSNALQALPIGRNMIDHPSGFVFKAKLRVASQLAELFGGAVEKQQHWRRRLGFRLKPENLALTGGRNHALYLRPAFGMRDPADYYDLKTKLVRRRGAKARLFDTLQLLKYPDLMLEAAASHYVVHPPVQYVSGFVVAEQMPEDHNQIVLNSDGRFAIHWNVSSDATRSIAGFLEMFFDEHADKFSGYRMSSGPLDSGGHHSGTCRMAAEPTQGVVDENFRVFGTSNIFVADGSIIPFSGHANTGLTIAALAHRCCDILRQCSLR